MAYKIVHKDGTGDDVTDYNSASQPFEDETDAGDKLRAYISVVNVFIGETLSVVEV